MKIKSENHTTLKKNKVATNATWIIACRVVQALLQFVVGMLTARYLGPSNYGTINYAASLVAFVVPIMHLGINNILVQELVDYPEEEGKILGTSLVLCLASSFACIIGVTAFAAVANPNEPITIVICFLYSITLLFQALGLLRYWYQAKLIAKYHSIISLFAYIAVSAYRIVLLALQKDVYWFAISNSIDYFFISAGIHFLYYKRGGAHLQFSKNVGKRLLRKSKHYIVSGLMVTIFAQTDKIMLKLMLDETATGLYSAAVTCAGITTFVFTAIIDSFRPVIFESLKKSKSEFELNMKRLYSIIIYVSLSQSVLMCICADTMIKLLYGSQYLASISALQIIVWYTTFSYLGSVRNIWILANNKQKYLWMINLSGALANVVLNMVFIPRIGLNGAALASLITQIFTNIIVGYIISPIRENNRLMIESLSPGILLEVIKTLKSSLYMKNKRE